MTVLCKVCRKPIEAGAEICTECSSYQDWTRHLFRWKDVIVAVAALAPLWLGAKALSDLVTSKAEAKIRVLPLRCDTESFTVAASNLGTAAGLIGRMQLGFITPAGISSPGIELRPRESSAYDPVLAPAATKVLNLQPQIAGVATQIPYPRVGKPCRAVADFTLLGFDGSSNSVSASCDCPELP